MTEIELIDFYPKETFKKSVRNVKLLYFTIYSFILISAMFFFSPTGFRFIIFILLWVLGIIVYILNNMALEVCIIATNWDDVDYTGFQKRNIEFQKTDSINHFAYLYVPSGLEISTAKSPAIIGFHGWNSHHREMDRYCLPTAKSENYLYFTMDARGQGNTKGDKNDIAQFNDAVKFIDMVASLPYVDSTKIAVVGMSMGGARASYAAYDHPYVRALVLLSGPYDLYYTRYHMTRSQTIIFNLSGCKFPKTDEGLKLYSGMNKFTAEGIKLAYTNKPVPNSERVYMAASLDDPVVTPVNTQNAIKKLNLPPSNYRIYPKGKHCFEGGEYFLSVDIYRFLTKCLKD
jgi:dienelactone hydrolase